jgi:hypothetical protein
LEKGFKRGFKRGVKRSRGLRGELEISLLRGFKSLNWPLSKFTFPRRV